MKVICNNGVTIEGNAIVICNGFILVDDWHIIDIPCIKCIVDN